MLCRPRGQKRLAGTIACPVIVAKPGSWKTPQEIAREAARTKGSLPRLV